jgi:two-component system, OmpR family, phosphate regulon response regulator PhoB
LFQTTALKDLLSMDRAPQLSRQALLPPTSIKPRVLVVEEHDDTREMLGVFFEYHGCRVIEARNGEQAISVAERDTPHLILLDMKLPGMDGLAVARLMRARPKLSNVPIVATTANAAVQFRSEVFKAGCDYVVVKPFEFKRLEEIVKSLIRAYSPIFRRQAERERHAVLT